MEIVRDNANVPHIFGESDQDVFYGLGFAHAQDRLWQMITMRRTVQGRLSEVFGTTTVRIDRLLRRFDLYTLSVQSLQALDPKTRAALDAYAAGVNARLDQINTEALGRGAPEMLLFDAPVAPWRAADSVALRLLPQRMRCAREPRFAAALTLASTAGCTLCHAEADSPHDPRPTNASASRGRSVG